MTIYSLSGLLTAVTSGLMAVLMLSIGKKKLHYLWAVFCFSVFLFGLGIFFVGGATTPADASFWWRVGHVGAIMIPVLFLHFVYEFLELKKTSILIFLYSVSVFFLVTDAIDGFFIGNMRYVFGQFYYDSPPGLFYPAFTIVFFGITIYSHYLLWKGHRVSNDDVIRAKIQLFFLGTAIGFSGGAFNFLPVYGIDVYPFMNLTVFLYPLIITYAIVKHQLFDIKLIFVELAIILLNLFLFLNIFTSHTQFDYALNISVSVAVVGFSAYLMRGIYKEIRDRERIEGLVMEMNEANERLRVMEGQKTEFVSIASHQLRTPLTLIKGYASMILEGTFGPISGQVRDAVDSLYKSSGKVVALVEDLLTVSRIEQGRTTINLSKVNFRTFVQEILAEMEHEARDAKIYLSFSMEGNGDFFVSIDERKLRQAARHIIDNAIKYSTGPGFVYVTIALDLVANKARLTVSDMGVGMTKEQIDNIFRRFNLETTPNGEQAIDEPFNTKKNNTHGIGLYIAQEIIQAHHGVLRVESAGPGYGTTVVIELPPDGINADGSKLML